jgi:hypothetical protein
MKRIAPGSIDPGALHQETAYGSRGYTMRLEEQKHSAVVGKFALAKQSMPKMKSPNHTQKLLREVELIRNLKRENRQLKQLVAPN